MIYASSKEELKKRLVGLACEIQGSDKADVEYDEVCCHLFVTQFPCKTCRCSNQSVALEETARKQVD